MAKKETHLPVFVDPSHAAGRRDLVIPLALAAAAAGDGAFALVPYAASDGLWFDLGTPGRLAAAEAALAR